MAETKEATQSEIHIICYDDSTYISATDFLIFLKTAEKKNKTIVIDEVCRVLLELMDSYIQDHH